MRNLALYRHSLPQLGSELFLTDGGLETTLVYHQRRPLRHFSAFELLGSPDGQTALRDYYRAYVEIARRAELGFILESATWRANPDWGSRLGYSDAALAQLNRQAIELLVELRSELATEGTPLVISGCVGPRGDGYRKEHVSEAEARDYHAAQIRVFADSGADLVSAITMTHAEEAIGVALAARRHEIPVVVSFTVETDGRLPSGQPLSEAIQQVDSSTHAYPAYFMLNCAHPVHFESALDTAAPWAMRLRGLRANASECSHAELDVATELDAGDPQDLARRYRALRERLPQLTVLGGCCGTDHRHVSEICSACVRR